MSAKPPSHTGARVPDRATAGSLGLALSVLTAWAFQAGTGITPPVEVATAWGTVVSIVVSMLWSRFGGVGR